MASLGQGQLKGARAYQNHSLADRDALIKKHIGLVKKVALHIKARLPPQVMLDDLIQSGMLGLIDAVQNFKPEQAASFEAYAMIRIRGEIIDHMRAFDWTPRTVHQNSRAVRAAETRLSQELGRAPTDSEVANEMQIDIKRLHQIRGETVRSQMVCLGETGMSDEVIADLPMIDPLTGRHEDGETPFHALVCSEFTKDIARFISQLPERERQILSLYYDQELNLREIGIVMNMSESRACQLLASAQDHLREDMGPLWVNGYKNPNVKTMGAQFTSSDPNRRAIEQANAARKSYKARSDLFADIDKPEPESDKSEQLLQSSGKIINIGTISFEAQRVFKCIRDPRFAETLTQRFNDGTLSIPFVKYNAHTDLTLNNELNISNNIHSSRPRMTLVDPHAARIAARDW